MSGERGRPAVGSALPAGLSRVLFYLAFGGVWTLMFLGSLYAGGRLYQPYDATLDWGPNGGMLTIGMMAGPLLFRCAPFDRGWRGALPGFVAAATVAAMLAANIAAVGVVLWAISPDAASGFGGLITVLIIALALTLPVIQGAFRLTERWRAANVPLREWLKDKNFLRQTGLGVFLGFLSIAPVMLATAGIEYWLLAAYPAAEKSAFVPEAAWTLVVLFTFTGTAPSDLRSALRSAAAALVVFETAIAADAAVALAAVTLQTDSLWLTTASIWPVLPVGVGAIMLLAHKQGGLGDEAADATAEEAGA